MMEQMKVLPIFLHVLCKNIKSYINIYIYILHIFNMYIHMKRNPTEKM